MGVGIVVNKAPSENHSQYDHDQRLTWTTRREPTRVNPIAPIFSEYLVVPFPVPMIPAMRQPIPSKVIPLLMVFSSGTGAPESQHRRNNHRLIPP